MARPFVPAFTPLTAAWVALCEPITNKHDLSFMRQLGSFCSSIGAEPHQVDEAAIVAYESNIRDKGSKRPTQLIRDTRKTWNRLSATLPSWPKTQLEIVSRRTNPSVAPEGLPESFIANVEAFLHRSSNGGRFKPLRKGPRADATRIDTRRKIFQLVTMLAAKGWDLSKLNGLQDLVLNRTALDIILDTMWDEGAGENCAHHYNRVRLLKAIAKDWANCDEETLNLLKEAEASFRETTDGLTERNKAKIRQFADENNIRRLVMLPANVTEDLHPEKPTLGEAIVVQSALAVSILLAAPVRAKNLASIDITKHIHRVSEANCYLVFPDHEVKNKVDLEYPLPLATIDLLDLYMKVYRPLLLAEETNALFISRSGRKKTAAELGAQIPRFIKDYLGIDLNLHLFRHLAAFLFLKKHPGEFETVSKLLNHKSSRTTMKFYVELNNVEAFKRFDAIVTSYVSKKTKEG
jgi:Phage integrase family